MTEDGKCVILYYDEYIIKYDEYIITNVGTWNIKGE